MVAYIGKVCGEINACMYVVIMINVSAIACVIVVLIEFPHFGNAVYGILMTGSNDDRFCLELGRSEFLYWVLSFLNVGVTGDLLKVCIR